MPEIVGEPDVGHAPVPELALEAIAILQDRSEGRGVGQTGLPEGGMTT
jgi:hypothetical protein